jgi:hypothetical protein
MDGHPHSQITWPMHSLVGEAPREYWKRIVCARRLSGEQLLKTIRYCDRERTQEGDPCIVTLHLQ